MGIPDSFSICRMIVSTGLPSFAAVVKVTVCAFAVSAAKRRIDLCCMTDLGQVPVKGITVDAHNGGDYDFC